MEHHNPLEQFAIQRIVPLHIGGIDVSITNSTVFMVLAIALITLFLTLSMRSGSLVPTRWQTMAELSYEFIGNMIREGKTPQITSAIQTGKNEGMIDMDSSIRRLFEAGTVSARAAYDKAIDKEQFKDLMEKGA